MDLALRKTTHLLFCVSMALTISACTHGGEKTKYYQLQTISDTQSGNKGEVTAYVQLNKAGQNVVSVFNLEKTYQLFRVYKQEQGQGDFKPKGTLKPGAPQNFMQAQDEIHKRLISFKDPEPCSLSDRYKIAPIVDGKELLPIRTTYGTDDPDYFRKIEDKEPDK